MAGRARLGHRCPGELHTPQSEGDLQELQHAAMQAAVFPAQPHGGTIWATVDSETWGYLQKTSGRARYLKKMQLVNDTWVLHLPDFSISK